MSKMKFKMFQVLNSKTLSVTKSNEIFQLIFFTEDDGASEDPKLILATEYKIVSQGKDFLMVNKQKQSFSKTLNIIFN